MLKRFIRNVPPIGESVEFLSGGQRQVVAIARAGAWGSKLILMDEPTAALGIAETKAVEDVIFGLKQQGLTILVISHNLDQIFRITERHLGACGAGASSAIARPPGRGRRKSSA